MPNKTNKYKLFNVFLMLVLLSTNSFAKNKMSFSEVIKENQHDLKNLTFTLNKEQVFLSGSSEKLILKDNSGDLWMFKMPLEYYDPDSYFGVPCIQTDSFIVSFYRACGLNRMKYYPVILSINGLSRYGNLMRLLPRSDTLEKINLDDLSLSQRQFIQKVFILDWLLAISGVDKGDFLISRDTGEMFTLDKEHAFRDLALPCYRVDANIMSFLDSQLYCRFYNDFFRQVLSKGKEIDLNDIFEFIDYIQSIDDKLFCDLFTPYLKEANTVKFNSILSKIVHEAQFEYLILKFDRGRYLFHVKLNRFLRKVSDKEVNNYLKLLLLRKQNMRKAFENFYKTMLNRKDFPVLDRASSHKKEKRDINAMLFTLKSDRMVDFINLSGKQDIKVVSSERAWFLLKQKSLTFWGKDKFIKELVNLKETSHNELIAIRLYIRRITEHGFSKDRIILTPKDAEAILSQ